MPKESCLCGTVRYETDGPLEGIDPYPIEDHLPQHEAYPSGVAD